MLCKVFMSINLGKYGNQSTIRIIYISCQWAESILQL